MKSFLYGKAILVRKYTKEHCDSCIFVKSLILGQILAKRGMAVPKCHVQAGLGGPTGEAGFRKVCRSLRNN